jgi:hypothetical protein
MPIGGHRESDPFVPLGKSAREMLELAIPRIPRFPFTARATRTLAAAAAAIGIIATLSWHAVSTSVTTDDERAIRETLARIPPVPPNHRQSYEQEIGMIAAVLWSISDAAPGNVGLPRDQPREPRNLFEARSGLCYDRSRAIEKVLRYLGFSARHVAIFSTKDTGSALKSLVTRGVPSHAITEVLTNRGWLVVDSNAPWLSLDARGTPLSVEAIAGAATNGTHLNFKSPPPTGIYFGPFTAVIGLYSRHGHFYPPYDSIPDVNYGELLQNFW